MRMRVNFPSFQEFRSTHGFLHVVFVTTVYYPDTYSVIYHGFHRAVASLSQEISPIFSHLADDVYLYIPLVYYVISAKHYAHAHAVCTRPSSSPRRRPGNEARYKPANIYTHAHDLTSHIGGSYRYKHLHEYYRLLYSMNTPTLFSELISYQNSFGCRGQKANTLESDGHPMKLTDLVSPPSDS